LKSLFRFFSKQKYYNLLSEMVHQYFFLTAVFASSASALLSRYAIFNRTNCSSTYIAGISKLADTAGCADRATDFAGGCLINNDPISAYCENLDYFLTESTYYPPGSKLKPKYLNVNSYSGSTCKQGGDTKLFQQKTMAADGACYKRSLISSFRATCNGTTAVFKECL
jgi:hypothetical protein